MRFRRYILYPAIIAVGLMWTIAARPIWLDPQRLIDAPLIGAAAYQFEAEEDARNEMFYHRLRITCVAVTVTCITLETLAAARRVVLG